MSWRSGKPVWLEEQGVGVFLAVSLSSSMGIFSARPLAGNASRWAASHTIMIFTFFVELLLPPQRISRKEK
jgi:hypothetical protein